MRKFSAIDPKPSDLAMGRLKGIAFTWRTEPKPVAPCWDDLWLGVKVQSNSGIAGFPRNLFR
jgi:hypothetical protein